MQANRPELPNNSANARDGRPQLSQSSHQLPTTLPTRVITYAWGEQYVDLLLSLTLPALLAPGNLPYVAGSTSCELVILSEERFFPTISAHSSVNQAKRLCLVRLVALDDLIASKDKYGMALTYALHRGFSDLGPAMTESWQIFLNADFVLAEGSLRSVISRLAKGERLVASPSYCVNAFMVEPALRERVCQGTGVLSIPARELAAIALAHRHTTIRGKSINQLEFTLRYMDQFYWLVDDRTLLGHQMPIAIVGMRPERHVVEPNSYWDHGLMLEYCPTAQLCVIGDSDEFLMIELRDKDVAQELIEPGRPVPKFIAERMISFLTEYQRGCARHELTLHSGEIPPEAATARGTLNRYIDEVLSHLPAVLPSHIDHPQWNYHRPGFVEFRHKFLSERLGSLTETLPPPVSLSELDRAWWEFDGMQKRTSRRRVELREFVDRELQLLQQAAKVLEHAGDAPGTAGRSESDCSLAGIRSRMAVQHSAISQNLDRYFNREGLTLIGVGLAHLEPSSSRPEHCSDLQGLNFKNPSEDINAVARGLSELYQLGSQLFDLELEVPRNEYRQLTPRRVASATIPYVETEEVSGADVRAKSVLGRVYGALFRRLTCGPLRPVDEIIAAAVAHGASRVLRVGSASHLPASAINRVRGYHTKVSTAGMTTGNFGKAFEESPRFDICICDLNLAELLEFPLVVAAVRPFMADRGIIVGFHLRQAFLAFPSDLALTTKWFSEEVIRVYRSGSWISVLLLRGMTYFRNFWGTFWFPPRSGRKLSFTSVVRSATRAGVLALLAPLILIARTLAA